MDSSNRIQIADLPAIREAVATEIEAKLADLRREIAGMTKQLEDTARMAQGIYTAKQVAQVYLDGARTPQTVKRWCREEGLPHTRHHGLWLIEREALETWLMNYSE